jgi:Protein of unknown function (DUF4232)
MRIRTRPGADPRGRRAQRLVLISVAAVGLAVGACSSPPTGSAGTSAPRPAVSGDSASPPASNATAAPAASAGSVPVCQTHNLKIVIGPTGAAAGMSGGDLEFTNTSSTACQLQGWPQLVGVSASGATATAVPVHSTQFGPFNGGTVSAVRLNAGATAGVVFIVGANSCTETYQTLHVTPPGNTGSVVVSAWLPQVKTYLPACAPIDVSPVVLASSLPNPAAQA